MYWVIERRNLVVEVTKQPEWRVGNQLKARVFLHTVDKVLGEFLDEINCVSLEGCNTRRLIRNFNVLNSFKERCVCSRLTIRCFSTRTVVCERNRRPPVAWSPGFKTIRAGSNWSSLSRFRRGKAVPGRKHHLRCEVLWTQCVQYKPGRPCQVHAEL